MSSGKMANRPMTLAEQLQTYIRRRAKVEGVKFDLPLEIFERAVKAGAKTFGVVHDGEKMLHDEQEPYPGFFEAMNKELMP